MSYQVIARKWRPQAFDEVTGQEHITRTLRNAIEHERLHHAYLFSGARGVGKTTTARLLAKALNCHQSKKPTPTPCRFGDPGACPSCQEIAEGRSIDVLEIDAASNTGVDNVREAIINNIGISPARDRFKVFIIDEVHMLSGAAFNALLKTLEEPPPRVTFVMATTESHKIPDTILSRSQQFEFRTIATQKIAERLRLIADAEKIKIRDDALREIARAGEGSMRDAQSAFDQVISFSEGEIKTEDVEAALGIAGAELRSRVMRAVSAGDAREVVAVVDDLTARGHDLRNFCRDLLAHLRDLLVVKVAGADAGAVDADEAERRELAREADEFSESDLVRSFHSLTETDQRLREGAHPRYQLEIGLVKLIEMRRLAPLGQVLERLRALEEALRTGGAPAASAGPTAAGGGGSGATGGPSSARGGGGSVPPASRFSNPRAVGRSAQDSAPKSFAAGGEATGGAQPAGTQVRGVARGGATLSAADVPPWESPAQSASQSVAPGGPHPVAQSAPQSSAGTAPALKLVTSEPQGPPRAANGVGEGFGLAAQQAPPRVETTPKAEVSSSRGAADSLAERLKDGLEAKRKPLLATALDGASRVALEGDELRVEFAPDAKHPREMLAKAENQKLLREVCCEVAGRQVGVLITTRAAGDAGGAGGDDDEKRREQQRLREAAERDPKVQDLLRTFRAQIVDVQRTE
jgi:DNA polymerase-3 subunit gamma/tau